MACDAVACNVRENVVECTLQRLCLGAVQRQGWQVRGPVRGVNIQSQSSQFGGIFQQVARIGQGGAFGLRRGGSFGGRQQFLRARLQQRCLALQPLGQAWQLLGRGRCNGQRH